MAEEDDINPALDALLTDHDRAVSQKAEEIIERAMREAPSWLTEAQRARVREKLEVDLLADPRGRAWLSHLIGGPAEPENSAALQKLSDDLQAQFRKLREDDGEAGAGG